MTIKRAYVTLIFPRFRIERTSHNHKSRTDRRCPCSKGKLQTPRFSLSDFMIMSTNNRYQLLFNFIYMLFILRCNATMDLASVLPFLGESAALDAHSRSALRATSRAMLPILNDIDQIWVNRRLEDINIACSYPVLSTPSINAKTGEVHLSFDALAQAISNNPPCWAATKRILHPAIFQHAWVHISSVHAPRPRQVWIELSSHFPDLVVAFNDEDWQEELKYVHTALQELSSILPWMAVGAPNLRLFSLDDFREVLISDSMQDNLFIFIWAMPFDVWNNTAENHLPLLAQFRSDIPSLQVLVPLPVHASGSETRIWSSSLKNSLSHGHVVLQFSSGSWQWRTNTIIHEIMEFGVGSDISNRVKLHSFGIPMGLATVGGSWQERCTDLETIIRNVRLVGRALKDKYPHAQRSLNLLNMSELKVVNDFGCIKRWCNALQQQLASTFSDSLSLYTFSDRGSSFSFTIRVHF
jgi:hypothetical protein